MTDLHVTTDRRIAAGDWVRMTGLSPSLRGVGKVVDADYDPKDGAMRAARVDMGAREYWIPVAELSRVQPDDEARLVEAAKARGLIDEERAPERALRLERTLEAVRRGAAAFVRSPGLLDMLWAFTCHADPDHGSRALAGLFDDALDLLVGARLGRADDTPPPASPGAPAWEPLGDAWSPGFPASQVVPRLLSQLDRMALVRRAEALAIDVGPVRSASTDELRSFVAARADLPGLLDVLWLRQLRDACRDGLGMGDADALSREELTARVLGFVERAAAPSPLTTRPGASIDASALGAAAAAARAEATRALMDAAARVQAERRKKLLPEVRGAEVLPRILNTLNHQPLIAVATAHGVSVPPMRQGSHRELAAGIVAAGVPLEAVLAQLTPNQLRLACGAVGFTGVIEGDPDALRARLLAAAEPDAPS